MRVDNNRYEEESKKNLKLIEEILSHSGKTSFEIMNIIEDRTLNPISNSVLNSNNYNNNNTITVSPQNYVRLREVYIINSLKNQIINLKKIINEKDDNISNLKNNEKIVNFVKIENELRSQNEELVFYMESYEKLKANFDETTAKCKEAQSERDLCKKQLYRYKSQYEEKRANLKNIMEVNSRLIENKKYLQEKVLFNSLFSKTVVNHNTNTPLNNTLNIKEVELSELSSINKALNKKNFDLQKENKTLLGKLEMQEKKKI